VRGEDGLDEVSLAAPTQVFEVVGQEVKSYSIKPEDAGLGRVPLDAVKSGTPAENAARMRAIFAGERCPQRDYVLINAAAALLTVGCAQDLKDGARLAAEAIDSGAAARLLDAYVDCTNSFGGSA
jgi:anthranilate phosphoribosyltransferase